MSNLERYRALRDKMLKTDDQAAQESMGDELDSIWYGLSDDDRAALDSDFPDKDWSRP